jgi:hypothetical protein
MDYNFFNNVEMNILMQWIFKSSIVNTVHISYLFEIIFLYYFSSVKLLFLKCKK